MITLLAVEQDVYCFDLPEYQGTLMNRYFQGGK